MNLVLRQYLSQQWPAGLVGTIPSAETHGEQETQHFLAVECERLRQAGYVGAIAPIHQNTWQGYRCIVENIGLGRDRPLFWREPSLPGYWPSALLQQGFEPIAHYYSAECQDLTIVDPRLPRMRDRFQHHGFTLQTADFAEPGRLLRQIYVVAIAAFARNLFFKPIPLSEFCQLYTPLLPVLNPQMVLLATDAMGAIMGFTLGIPDLAAEPTQTIILKTVAILPGQQYYGIGSWLVAEFHRHAREQNYQCVIHALMHETNPSLNISRRYAQPFRRYALFGKQFT